MNIRLLNGLLWSRRWWFWRSCWRIRFGSNRFRCGCLWRLCCLEIWWKKLIFNSQSRQLMVNYLNVVLHVLSNIWNRFLRWRIALRMRCWNSKIGWNFVGVDVSRYATLWLRFAKAWCDQVSFAIFGNSIGNTNSRIVYTCHRLWILMLWAPICQLISCLPPFFPFPLLSSSSSSSSTLSSFCVVVTGFGVVFIVLGLVGGLVGFDVSGRYAELVLAIECHAHHSNADENIKCTLTHRNYFLHNISY